MIDFKGSQFEKEIILWGVRWYVPTPQRPPMRREEAGARGGRGARHAQSLGHPVGPRGGKTVPPPTAAGGEELAEG